MVDKDLKTRGRWWVEEGPQTPEEFDEWVRDGRLIITKVTKGVKNYIKSHLIAGWYNPYWIRYITKDDGKGIRTVRAVRAEDYNRPIQ